MDQNLALLVIDMQRPYWENLEREERRTLLASQMHMLQTAVLYDIPVAVLEYQGDGPTIDHLSDIISKVPRSAHIVKRGRCGFCNTHLHDILKVWTAQTLIIMGTNTSACVRGTMETAHAHSYTISTTYTLIADHVHQEPMVTAATLSWISAIGILHPSLESLCRFHNINVP